MKNLIYVGILIFISSCKTSSEPWENLIGGSDLNDWVQLQGTATFELKDGIIVGTTGTNPAIGYSVLSTKTDYGDFILEFDSWFNTNAGVQIRNKTIPDDKNPHLHGYQIDLDPSVRAWTGGISINEKSDKLWLYPLERNLNGKKAFRNGEWNHFRIEAFGNSIRTWVNGISCADIVDDRSLSGRIGLVVSGKENKTAIAGNEVKWSNIKIITADIEKYLSPYDAAIVQQSYLINKLSEREVNDGWRLLWDGKTTHGWRGARLDTFPAGGWEIKDGALSVLENNGTRSPDGGDIVTVDKFKNFELIVDFKYSPGANSGIKYFVDTDLNKEGGSAIGCEYSILDEELHPDAKEGIDGNRKQAGLYDLIGPSSKLDNGAEAWNRATIVVNGTHVEHWLNGLKTVEYERGNSAWRALVAKSKFRVWPYFGEADEGHILLQDHGGAVSFRNIKLREINVNLIN